MCNRGSTRLSSRADSAWHRQAFIVVVLVASIGAIGAADARLPPAYTPERHPRVTWAPCNRNARDGRPSTFRPLSDAQAAALTTPEAETRSYNARPYTIQGKSYPAANNYVPSTSQLRRYRDSRTSLGEPLVTFSPYARYVDGRDGLLHPSTDALIQWAAHKWGIPEDWLRAEYIVESYWNQFQLGDATKVTPRWYSVYPYQSRIPHTTTVYQSLGMTQVRWTPDGGVGPGTEPLRWESTAFNVDEQAARVRFYYDNPSAARSAWGDPTYVPCQAWRSIGAWYSPYPWGNSGQSWYIRAVRAELDGRAWASPSFADWSPSSFPPGITFK